MARCRSCDAPSECPSCGRPLTPCREYRGVLDTNGYGRINRGKERPGRGRQPVLLHRWIMEQVTGPLAPGVQVLHRCDNPPCFRFDHLFLGTQADNIADMDRAEITRSVYQRLADPRFRARLTATAPDGTRPILIALRTDPMSALLDQLDAVGRAASVVVPYLNGFFLLTMHEDADASDDAVQPLTADCTVGVFLARMLTEDQPTVYGFQRPNRSSETGTAELVALGA